MSNSITRPVRIKRQPLRNRDKVELNMELIQRLENSKGSKSTGNVANVNGKLLVAFINAINESFRVGRDEVKEKQLEMKKYAEEEKKITPSLSNNQTKRSKLNDGKVAQHMVESSKNEDKKMQRATEMKQGGLNQKTRSSNAYSSKRENQKLLSKEKPQKPETSPKNSNTSIIKPFKRHSFHAAIAYRIHIEKLNFEHNTHLNPELLDPTYPAKKLKEEQARAAL